MIASAMDNCIPETFYTDVKPHLRSRIARAVSGAHKVVDLGCGNCELAFFLAERNRQEVIGVDLSDESFPQEAQAGKDETGNVQCVKKDARALSFLDENSVDAVVSTWALHEMDSPVSVLGEARRILRPGGQVLIVDFPKGSLAQRLWNEHYFAPQEVAAMLKNSGFMAVRCKPIADGQIIWARSQKKNLNTRVSADTVEYSGN